MRTKNGKIFSFFSLSLFCLLHFRWCFFFGRCEISSWSQLTASLNLFFFRLLRNKLSDSLSSTCSFLLEWAKVEAVICDCSTDEILFLIGKFLLYSLYFQTKARMRKISEWENRDAATLRNGELNSIENWIMLTKVWKSAIHLNHARAVENPLQFRGLSGENFSTRLILVRRSSSRQ